MISFQDWVDIAAIGASLATIGIFIYGIWGFWPNFIKQKRLENAVTNAQQETTFPIKNGQGWGDRKAIKNTQMEQAGFLKDDTFYIEAEIAVKKVMWAV